jgi:hypothetical protein
MRNDNLCFYLQNRLDQTSQTGGQWYGDTSPFSIPWFKLCQKKINRAQTLYLIGHVLMNRLKILIIGSSVSGGNEEGHLIDGEN